MKEYIKPTEYTQKTLEIVEMKIEEWNYVDAEELCELLHDYIQLVKMEASISLVAEEECKITDLYHRVGAGPYTPDSIDRGETCLWGVDENYNAVVGDDDPYVVSLNELFGGDGY